MARANQRFHRDDEAVSEALATVLLVAITLVMATSFGLMLSRFSVPLEHVPAQVNISVLAGSAGWGSGDELVQVVHGGGKTLISNDVTVGIQTTSGINKVLRGSTLGSTFSDGELRLGETWIHGLTIPGGDNVSVIIVHHQQAGSTVIASAEQATAVGLDCSTDTAPPVLSSTRTIPDDIDSETIGPVVIRVTLTDACAGVDRGSPPNLMHRLEDGTSPPFVDAGPMVHVSGTTFTISVAEDWGMHAGKSFEYFLRDMADQLGNTGDSGVTSQIVEDVMTVVKTFPNAPPTIIKGTVTDYSKLQDDADAGQEARFTETGTPTPTVVDRYATTSSGQRGAQNPQNAEGAPDDVRAVLPDHRDEIRTGGFGTGSGTISKVRIAMEAHYAGTHQNDQLRVRYRLGGGVVGSAFLTSTQQDTDIREYFDVTSDRSWTWSDIELMEAEVEYRRDTLPGPSGSDALDFRVDAVWVEITYQVTGYSMNIQMAFTGVPNPAGTHALEIKYRTLNDRFFVQVDQGAGTWVTRGAVLNSGPSTAWPGCTLSPLEYAGGSPKIRIIDDTPAGPLRGEVLLDYVRIRTT